MIITKSISRFGRNAEEIIETISNLNKLGVDIYFETVDIHSSKTLKTPNFPIKKTLSYEKFSWYHTDTENLHR